VVVGVAGEQDAARAQDPVGVEFGDERLSDRSQGRLHPAGGDDRPGAQRRAGGGAAETDETGDELVLAA
jgi:hypothetical protein